MRIAASSLSILLALLLAACATTTSVVMLDPSKQYPPTSSVQILLKAPDRPYVEIAKLESQGIPGEPETAVLEDARERAAKIGADAIIVQESSSVYQPPVVMYDPWPVYMPWYYDRWYGYGYPFWYYPSPFGFQPYAHTLPGGNAYTVRSIAIKFK
jgi:hypothetical protein